MAVRPDLQMPAMAQFVDGTGPACRGVFRSCSSPSPAGGFRLAR
jgi:hypothetical protein